MKYTVKAGDTLSKIAKDVLGDANRWREIYEANKDKIQNPNQIRPGWELVIAVPEAEEKAEAEAEAEEKAEGGAEKKPKAGIAGDSRHEMT